MLFKGQMVLSNDLKASLNACGTENWIMQISWNFIYFQLEIHFFFFNLGGNEKARATKTHHGQEKWCQCHNPIEFQERPGQHRAVHHCSFPTLPSSRPSSRAVRESCKHLKVTLTEKWEGEKQGQQSLALEKSALLTNPKKEDSKGSAVATALWLLGISFSKQAFVSSGLLWEEPATCPWIQKEAEASWVGGEDGDLVRNNCSGHSQNYWSLWFLCTSWKHIPLSFLLPCSKGDTCSGCRNAGTTFWVLPYAWSLAALSFRASSVRFYTMSIVVPTLQ